MSHIQNRSELEQRLEENWPARAWADSHVVLGVSGGADSVAMLCAMVRLKSTCVGSGKLFVAHLNHGIRAADADADEAWLASLCGRLGVPLEVGKMDVAAIAANQGDGWEAAARTARYDFLLQTAERLGARFVATAHTVDDQVETVLHRILRGTGIEGLSGMRRTRPLSASVALVRPLLAVQRREVLEYLNAIGQDYRNDATNQDTKWTRNWLRHELLPQLRERCNRKVDIALCRLAAQAREAQELICGVAVGYARDCVSMSPERVRIDCTKLSGQPRIIVREVCKLAWSEAGWPEQAMGFDQWQQLAALVGGADQKVVNLPGNVRALREERFLVLERAA